MQLNIPSLCCNIVYTDCNNSSSNRPI